MLISGVLSSSRPKLEGSLEGKVVKAGKPLRVKAREPPKVAKASKTKRSTAATGVDNKDQTRLFYSICRVCNCHCHLLWSGCRQGSCKKRGDEKENWQSW